MDKVGTHGCFFCGASVVVDKAKSREDKVVYVCTNPDCGKKVTVTVEKAKESDKE